MFYSAMFSFLIVKHPTFKTMTFENWLPLPRRPTIGNKRVDFVKFFTYPHGVTARFTKFLVVVTLVATTGFHWITLQTIAWTTMFAANMTCENFFTAVSETFDGRHLCPLCKAIRAGKKSENKSDTLVLKLKLEYPPLKENFVLIAPSRFQLLPQKDSFAKSLSRKPPLPPPRSFFV